MSEATRRRSMRQKVKIAEVDSMDIDRDIEENDGTFNDNDEDDFEEPQEKKRKRRASQAKNAQASGSAAVKKARTRGTRGVLKQVLEMPFDILFEIFGHMLPADLLSVGRTSQELRELVMSNQFKSIWAHARSRFAGMPECPSDMNEPAYAELVFGNGCLGCGKTAGNQYHVWSARTRLCTKCFDARYDPARLSRPDPTPIIYGLRESLCEVIPVCRVLVRRGRRQYMQWHVSTEHANIWKAELASLGCPELQEKWCTEKIAEYKVINEHAKRCEEWYPQLKKLLQGDKDAEVNERKQQVVQLLKTMGWGEELSKMTKDFPQDSPEVVKHCKKKLTDRILENLKPFLEEYMKDAKEKRLLNERRLCYENRMRVLQTAYNDALATFPLYQSRPRVGDVFEIPRIKSLIMDTPDDETIEAADFGITEETLADVIEEANEIINSKLLTVVAKELAEGTYDPATVLNLATTVFFFAGSYERKPLHTLRAITDLRSGLCNAEDIFQSVAAQVFEYVAFNARDTLAFDKGSHDVLCNLLTTCGFDPTTTTYDEMEEKQPIIECVKCNQISRGRLVMKWWDAPRHYRNSHSENYPAEFVPVTGEDAVTASKIIEDEDERRRYIPHLASGASVCLRCNDNTALKLLDMRAHFKDRHDVLYPKIGEDYKHVYEVNVSYSGLTTDAQRLWPGRP